MREILSDIEDSLRHSILLVKGFLLRTDRMAEKQNLKN